MPARRHKPRGMSCSTRGPFDITWSPDDLPVPCITPHVPLQRATPLIDLHWTGDMGALSTCCPTVQPELTEQGHELDRIGTVGAFTCSTVIRVALTRTFLLRETEYLPTITASNVFWAQTKTVTSPRCHMS
jgi:hypothetical protein